MQKNDELILKIEDMGVDGAGIGKSDGMTFFVKDAVIGDVVRAKIIKLKKTCGSVSYTHLDVYKRQVPALYQRLPLWRKA